MTKRAVVVCHSDERRKSAMALTKEDVIPTGAARRNLLSEAKDLLLSFAFLGSRVENTNSGSLTPLAMTGKPHD
jgi:hypothetical protein